MKKNALYFLEISRSTSPSYTFHADFSSKHHIFHADFLYKNHTFHADFLKVFIPYKFLACGKAGLDVDSADIVFHRALGKAEFFRYLCVAVFLHDKAQNLGLTFCKAGNEMLKADKFFRKQGIHVKHSPQNGVDGIFKLTTVALLCNIPHCTRFDCGVQKTGGRVFAVDYDFYFGIKFVAVPDKADSGVAVTFQIHIGDKDFGKRVFFSAVFRFLHEIKKIQDISRGTKAPAGGIFAQPTFNSIAHETVALNQKERALQFFLDFSRF